VSRARSISSSPGAGIVNPQPLAETTGESFDKVFAINNTRGLTFTVKKALPFLTDGGAIIVITSIAWNKGILGFTAYSATKAAVRSRVSKGTAVGAPHSADRAVSIGRVPSKVAISLICITTASDKCHNRTLL